MRISDWSSDVCSSDLWPALCRARQTGWRGALAGPYLVEAVRDADLGGRPANRAGRDHRARRPVVARTEICAMTAPVITRRLALWLPLAAFLWFVLGVVFGARKSVWWERVCLFV